jgi:hypothetical protein
MYCIRHISALVLTIRLLLLLPSRFMEVRQSNQVALDCLRESPKP